jgi:hypothetical protein
MPREEAATAKIGEAGGSTEVGRSVRDALEEVLC